MIIHYANKGKGKTEGLELLWNEEGFLVKWRSLQLVAYYELENNRNP